MIGHMLTDKELALLLEVLEAESEKLALETRHTDAREMRHEMRERERTLDRLIERFKEIKGGMLTP